MAIALTQSVTGNGASLALNGVVAAAFLTLQDSYYIDPGPGTAETAPTDTQGTWSVGSSGVPGTNTLNSHDAGSGIFYQENVAAGTHTVTPQATSGKNSTLAEWSGISTTSPLDGSADNKSNNFAGTSLSTGTTGTTTQADELVLITIGLGAAVGVNPVGFTNPVSGFTTLHHLGNNESSVATLHAYKIISATGTQSATFNWTDTEANQYCGAAIATFKDASGPPPAAPRIVTPVAAVSMR